MKKENISDAVIRRLPRYYRQLTDLYHRGIVRTSFPADLKKIKANQTA